jgi:hypothetical protein
VCLSRKPSSDHSARTFCCPRACAAEIGAWLEAAASAHKTGIMDKFALGEISALQACRLIRRSGLVAA